ncbi:MAG: SDR family oxidoreductase [Bacteroidia bacterium]|nr:SDR family oxidoreductase [Bacteroidia bacterium]
MNISDLKILVTGGAGFIGSHLCSYFLQAGVKQLVVLDDLSTGFKKNIEPFLAYPHFKFIQASIVDKESCLQACEGIDIVLHHAALGSVPRSIENPIATNEVNVSGFVNMLFAAKEQGVEKFIYASSSSVYGSDTTFPKVETKIGALLSPYAVSKYTNEKYAAVFSDLYNLQTIGFRYFNVFGERQNPHGAYAAVIPKFIHALMKQQSPQIYGAGQNTRDFTYVANVVEANRLAILSEAKDKSLVMNIAFGGTISVNEIYHQIQQFTNTPHIEPVYMPERSGEIKDSYADISLAKEKINFKPIVPLNEGLKKTVDWFLAQKF